MNEGSLVSRLGIVLLFAAVVVGALAVASVGTALFIVRRTVEPAEWLHR